jgi:hypothetical protein
MKNVEMNVEDNILTIKVDLSKEFGPSSSGKTIIIASTEGNVAIDGHEEAKIGLNVYKKKWQNTADAASTDISPNKTGNQDGRHHDRYVLPASSWYW